MENGGFKHATVMLREAVDALAVRPGGLYADFTLGGGGHTERILSLGGRVIGIDKDAAAIESCVERLRPYGERFTAAHGKRVHGFA